MSQTADKEWLEGREAAELLSQINGRPINIAMVRKYALEGKVTQKRKPGGYIHINVYLRSDIEGLELIKPLRGWNREGVQDYAAHIEELYQANPAIKTTDIEKQLGCARATASRYLKPLREAARSRTAEKPEDDTRTP